MSSNMHMVNLVQVADEYARQSYNLENEDVWILDSYSVKRASVNLVYVVSELGITLATTIPRSLVDGMMSNRDCPDLNLANEVAKGRKELKEAEADAKGDKKEAKENTKKGKPVRKKKAKK